ncbi:MAG: ABC transporter permease [Clostridiales bacterium]|nr:ABC transporter permease [Clostridiales bacterium]
MTIFHTTLKRIIKQPANWVFVLIFPVVFTILISFTITGDSVANDDVTAGMRFGVVDRDDSVLSRTLVEQLEKRYTIQGLKEEDVSAALTDSEIPWALIIREGYERDILAGRSPALEGYSLTVSDVSALGNVSAQNITRALLLLGTNDPLALAAWEEASLVDVTALPADNWETAAQWFGFYGFVSVFTAYFVIKTLIDDKRGGMPARLGVLPQSTRSILTQGVLAAFLMTEISVILLLLVLQALMGTVANPAHLMLLLSLYNLFAVGMVLAIVSFLKDLGAVSVAMSMLTTVFAMLGGLFWPLDLVPEFMRRLAWFSPGYWLARGLANIREITFEGFVMPILFLAVFTAVVLLISGFGKIQQMED